MRCARRLRVFIISSDGPRDGECARCVPAPLSTVEGSAFIRRCPLGQPSVRCTQWCKDVGWAGCHAEDTHGSESHLVPSPALLFHLLPPEMPLPSPQSVSISYRSFSFWSFCWVFSPPASQPLMCDAEPVPASQSLRILCMKQRRKDTDLPTTSQGATVT